MQVSRDFTDTDIIRNLGSSFFGFEDDLNGDEYVYS